MKTNSITNRPVITSSGIQLHQRAGLRRRCRSPRSCSRCSSLRTSSWSLLRLTRSVTLSSLAVDVPRRSPACRRRSPASSDCSRLRVTLALHLVVADHDSRQIRQPDLLRLVGSMRSSTSMNRSFLSGRSRDCWPRPAARSRSSGSAVSLRLLKIVTINSSSTPSPSRYQTKLPLCWGSFLSDDLGCGFGVRFLAIHRSAF